MTEWESIADAGLALQGAKNAALNPTVAALIDQYATGTHLFDFGCGWGEVANLMAHKGYQVVAYDTADSMVRGAKGRFGMPTFLTKKEFAERLPALEAAFDIVTCNLVLCILEEGDQDKVLADLRVLCKSAGIVVVTICHPLYDYLPEGLVSKRIVPPGARYEDTFRYEKVIKENGARFHDYHRPLEYYTQLFEAHGLSVLESKDSDTSGTDYKPDFITFVLTRA